MIPHGLPASGSRQRAATDNIAATALFHFNPGLPVPLPADPSGTRSELISCVAAEASSAVLKDHLSADRRYLNSPDACRPAALCDTGECRTARDASPKSPRQARGRGYTRSIGADGALMERRRELGGPVSRWNRR